MSEFCYKVYKIQMETVLAICDIEVAGKIFEEGKITLDARTSFYNGGECGPIKAKRLFEEATIINAIGERAVQLMLEYGLIDEERILWVEGVPHAQMVKLE